MSFLNSVAGYLATALSPRRDGGERSSQDQARQYACRRELRRFLHDHGEAGAAAVRLDEIRGLIGRGIEPIELRQLLHECAARVPSVLLGERRTRGRSIPVHLPLALRLRHVVVPGRTGAGKTTLVRHMIRSDAVAGHGLGVIALEAELIREEILPFLPPDRWDDVVLIDPADMVRPVSFNPLHLAPGEDLDLKASQLNVTLKRLCSEEGGTGAPRMELILSMAIYALLGVPDRTLLDIERLVDRQSPSFRQWIVAHTTDERTRHFWATTYEAMPRDAHLSLLNRLGKLLRPKVVRNLLCQPGASFNVREAMDTGKIVLVQLPDGLLGEDTSALLAQLFAAQWQLSAMSRANIQASQRRPFFLYLDEAQRTAGVAESSFEQLFARSRKYGLGLTLAFQHFGQMPEGLVRDMLATVGTIVSFQSGGTDARRLARELVGESRGQVTGVHPDQLVSLPIGQAICRIGRSVFRLHGLPPLQGGDTSAPEEIRRRSRENYGVTPMPSAPRHVASEQPLDDGGVL